MGIVAHEKLSAPALGLPRIPGGTSITSLVP